MDESQVSRISTALQDSANAIQGINNKFDDIDEHWRQVQDFNQGISSKVQDTLDAMERLDQTVNQGVDRALDALTTTTDELTISMQATLKVMQQFDIHREMNSLPKAIIPFAIPLIVLLIELSVANAYLGILLASVPEVRRKYSEYLFGNASGVLLGLTTSLIWLIAYRLWLSHKTRTMKEKAEDAGADVQEEAPNVEDLSDDSSLFPVSQRLSLGSSDEPFERQHSPGLFKRYTSDQSRRSFMREPAVPQEVVGEQSRKADSFSMQEIRTLQILLADEVERRHELSQDGSQEDFRICQRSQDRQPSSTSELPSPTWKPLGERGISSASSAGSTDIPNTRAPRTSAASVEGVVAPGRRWRSSGGARSVDEVAPPLRIHTDSGENAGADRMANVLRRRRADSPPLQRRADGSPWNATRQSNTIPMTAMGARIRAAGSSSSSPRIRAVARQQSQGSRQSQSGSAAHATTSAGADNDGCQPDGQTQTAAEPKPSEVPAQSGSGKVMTWQKTLGWEQNVTWHTGGRRRAASKAQSAPPSADRGHMSL